MEIGKNSQNYRETSPKKVIALFSLDLNVYQPDLEAAVNNVLKINKDLGDNFLKGEENNFYNVTIMSISFSK